MEPIIEKNDLIVIKEFAKYDLNDIVTYVDYEGTLITHRIVQIDEYSFMARGDNNSVIDESVDVEKIQGKVIYHSKFLGSFVLYYLKIIIFISFLLFIIFCFRDKFVKEENVETKEK